MKDGTYKIGRIKIKAPSNTYNIGDRVYFDVVDVED